jgi:hypothetical protein
MTTSGLAFTVLTLVATLAALDLSGAHQMPALQPAAAQPSVLRVDQSTSDDIEARLVMSFADSSKVAAATGPAIHRCATADGVKFEGPAQYCFGAPAPEIIYD